MYVRYDVLIPPSHTCSLHRLPTRSGLRKCSCPARWSTSTSTSSCTGCTSACTRNLGPVRYMKKKNFILLCCFRLLSPLSFLLTAGAAQPPRQLPASDGIPSHKVRYSNQLDVMRALAKEKCCLLQPTLPLHDDDECFEVACSSHVCQYMLMMSVLGLLAGLHTGGRGCWTDGSRP